MIAAYFGPECEDAQHVFITVLEHSNLIIKLPPKTGNPLIWHDDIVNKYFIIYSKFDDADSEGNKPLTPVQRWMYCSMWFAEINVDRFELVNNVEIKDAFGLLARCAPYKVNGRYLLPFYREKDPRCEVWTYSFGKSFNRLSFFGQVTEEETKQRSFPPSKLGNGYAIQPTLVKVPDGSLLAFCRNVCSSAEDAWLFVSKDDGLTWTSKPVQTKIPNHNNSLVAIPWDNDYMLLFNKDKYRSEIILGNRVNPHGLKLGTIIGGQQRQSFSYPNYCIDGRGDLHMIHSNCGMLAVHKMDKEFVDAVMFNNYAGTSKKSKIK